MLYGNELCLIVFELLLICTIDYATGCFITDVVIVYLVVEASTASCHHHHHYHHRIICI